MDAAIGHHRDHRSRGHPRPLGSAPDHPGRPTQDVRPGADGRRIDAGDPRPALGRLQPEYAGGSSVVDSRPPRRGAAERLHRRSRSRPAAQQQPPAQRRDDLDEPADHPVHDQPQSRVVRRGAGHGCGLHLRLAVAEGRRHRRRRHARSGRFDAGLSRHHLDPPSQQGPDGDRQVRHPLH